METIGERIKKRRESIGLSVDELAGKLGKDRATVYRYESDAIKNMPITILEPLALALQTTPAYFILQETEGVYQVKEAKKTIQVPVLGSIPAGVPVEAVQDVIEWIEIPESWERGGRQHFGLLVKGVSMFPDYMDGDIVIVRQQATCDNGDDCVIIINDHEATLKRVHLLEDGIELEAVNRMYGRKKYDIGEVKTLPVSILGVVVEQRRKRK